jgi:hypothetical protein
MRVATLPSPGLLSNGVRIRIEAAKAISAVEINAGRGGGKARNAYDLKTFFDTCSAAVAGFVETVLPTAVSRAITASNPSRIVITCSEGLAPEHVPAPSAFAVTGQVRTVTAVALDGPFIYLTVDTPFVAGAVSVAYTQPATNKLRDESHNLLASFTAAAVTNGIA